jgi:hypothetical protein
MFPGIGLHISQIMLWIGAYFIVILWAYMQWHGKLPSPQSFQEIASVINSRGGNILVLGGFSILFFVTSIRFVYWVLGKQIEGKITIELALGTAAFSWLTGSAFGGAFTSMVKAMTGENTKARSSDSSGGNGGGPSLVITPGAPVVRAQAPPEDKTAAPAVDEKPAKAPNQFP